MQDVKAILEEIKTSPYEEVEILAVRYVRLATDTAVGEVDKRRCSDIECKTPAPKETSAAAGLGMGFEHDRGKSRRLEPRCRGHARDAATQDRDIKHG